MNTKETRSIDAINLVVRCGVPPCLRGCSHLARAAELYADGMISFTEIYKTIGAERGIRHKTVMRSIAYAIQQAFELVTKLSELIRTEIPKSQIHNSLVISYFGLYLRNQA